MATYTYTILDRTASGINDLDQMVGSYADANGTHGFFYGDGVYTQIDDPLSTNGVTSANGVNDLGQIVGAYGSLGPTNSEGSHGYVYSDGVYTTIDDPLATNGTVPTAINDLGQIVGYYFDSTGTHGFLYSGGIYTTLNDPTAGTIFTVPTGINDTGQIVGHYNLSSSNAAHGFLYAGGAFTTIDDPLATFGTSADNINNAGQIVGHYMAGDNVYGYVYSHGVFSTFSDPAGTMTTPLDINDLGQIVGYYNPAGQGGIPFLATPTPTLTADRGHTDVQHTLSVSAAEGVLANDQGYVPNDSLTVSAVDGQAANVGHSVLGAYGSLTLNTDGSC
jgi:probable HAF family extracellular repeat protein